VLRYCSSWGQKVITLNLFIKLGLIMPINILVKLNLRIKIIYKRMSNINVREFISDKHGSEVQNYYILKFFF
jgi:hypothetical protein